MGSGKISSPGDRGRERERKTPPSLGLRWPSAAALHEAAAEGRRFVGEGGEEFFKYALLSAPQDISDFQ
jgi:hypothetical protein